MSIRIRLILGFSIVISLMVALTSFALLQMKETKDRLDWIVDVSAKKVEIAQQLKKDLLYFTVVEKNVLLVPKVEEKKVFINSAEQAAKEVEYSINKLRPIITDNMKSEFATFIDEWNRYLGISHEVHQLAQSESRQKAHELSKVQGLQAFDDAISTLQSLVLMEASLAELPVGEQQSARQAVDMTGSLALHVEANMHSMQESEKNLIVANNEEEIGFIVGEIEGSQFNAQDYLDSLREFVESEKSQWLRLGLTPLDDIRWFESQWSEYLLYSKKIRDLISENTAERARKLSIVQGEPQLARVLLSLDSIITMNEQTMLADKELGQRVYERTRIWLVTVVLIAILISVLIGFYLSRSITNPLQKLVLATGALAKGDSSVRSTLNVTHEMQSLSQSFNEMAQTIDERVWLQTELNRISTVSRGEQDKRKLANNIIGVVTERLDIPVGALYLEDDGVFSLAGRYGLTAEFTAKSYEIGEGVIGQVARDGKVKTIDDITLDEKLLHIDPGLPHREKTSTVIQPLIHDGGVLGVIVLGIIKPLTETEYSYLAQASESIAVTISMAVANKKQFEYLQATQKQAAQLNLQQEALADANVKLESSNDELEGKRALLEEQKVALENAKREVELQSDELRKANTYKSEFLANMSHELRTPLNSLLLLSKTLSKNAEKNLTDDQVKSLTIIYNGGHDLLTLINDILDLSKVEAGKLDIYLEPFTVADLCEGIELLFRPLADDKRIGLNVKLDEAIPDKLCSDKKRIIQIVRNLMSNAFKFTEEGSIDFSVYIVPCDQGKSGEIDCNLDVDQVVFEVTDSGVGIPPEKQELIFESFQQADGTTSRQYGGTGLGLAISRELARLISGHITLESEAGKGSTFRLFIPLLTELASDDVAAETEIEVVVVKKHRPSFVQQESAIPLQSTLIPGSRVVEDDRNEINEGDKKLLIVEDDVNFASVLRDLAREREFKIIVSHNGEEGLALAKEFRPDVITLDMGLPGMGGAEVLKQLRLLPEMDGIPIYIITSDDTSSSVAENGANGFLTKPISQEDLNNILNAIGEPSRDDSQSDIPTQDSAQEDIESVTSVLESALPIATRVVDECDLVDETVLVGSLSKKRVLIVDDDIRNMFALSQILSVYDMDVLKADNGQLALDRLDQNDDVDLILMDIMMPVMNGYEAMEKIRVRDDYAEVPIIALTAQTTQSAYEKCIEAGATEFLTKPVDEHILFARMHHCLGDNCVGDNCSQDKKPQI